jgi:hypothetical protein
MAKSTKFATAADVRAWAVEHPDLAGPVKSGEGVRGRIPAKAVEAFETAHKGIRYRTGKALPESTVAVKGKNPNGRTVTRKVVPRQVRAWGLANGQDVKPQGAIPKSVFTAYLAAGCPTE